MRPTVMRPRRRRNRLILPGVVILLVVVAPMLVRLYADLLWFGELGLTRVLSTELATRAALFGVVGLLAFGVLYANARIAQRRRAFGTSGPIVVHGPDGAPRDVTALVWRATVPLTLVVAVMLGLTATSG